MSKHTPGPWKWGVDFNGLCGPEKGMEVLRFQMYEGMWLEYGESQEANARLIAAAPDLLEALVELEAGSGSSPGANKRFSKARAAIAKARGE